MKQKPLANNKKYKIRTEASHRTDQAKTVK